MCGSDNISTLFDYIFKYSRVLQVLNDWYLLEINLSSILKHKILIFLLNKFFDVINRIEQNVTTNMFLCARSGAAVIPKVYFCDKNVIRAAILVQDT